MMACSQTERVFETPHGEIHYWATTHVEGAPNLVFLPGLTADHRLFDEQLEYFAGKANCLVWDPPSHGASRPFELCWSLRDKVCWLHEIIEREGFASPVLIGQSMGGYLAQVYMERYPGETSGFVSIDSAPLGRAYYSGWEISFLKHTHAMYSSIPWKWLISWGSNGCATTEYGRVLMREMMEGYSKREYVDLAAHGYKVLAEAVEAGLPYEADCPSMLLCGTKDRAGSCKRYSKEWTKRTGIPLRWIEGAGHNSNTDAPDEVNSIIEEFIENVSLHSTAGMPDAANSAL